MQYHRKQGVPVVILRPGFVYGPRDRMVLPRLADRLRERSVIYIARGKYALNTTFVGNIADAVVLAIDSPNAVGEVFNITDGEFVSKRRFFETVADGLGVKRPRSFPPVPVWLARLLANWRERKVPPRKPPEPPPHHASAAQVRRPQSRFLDRQGAGQNSATRRVCLFNEGMKQGIEWYRGQESGVGSRESEKAGVIADIRTSHDCHHLPPAVVYSERLAARRAVVAEQSARLDTLSYARLASFLVGLVVAGLAFGAELFSPWFALLPVVVFLFFVAKFEMARGRKTWAERAAAFYAGSLARLEGKPSGAGDGTRFADEKHAYSADLDLFGCGSVFERLTACRTRIGEETLAAWLLAPANPDEVKERQQAVADLTPRLDLRESLAVAGANVPAADYHPLAEWGAAHPNRPHTGSTGPSSYSAGPMWQRGLAGYSLGQPGCQC